MYWEKIRKLQRQNWVRLSSLPFTTFENLSRNSICLSSCLSFPDWFYWHTRTRYRDAIGALVFEWQYLRRPGFRTDRSMCFLNKKTIQDSQTRTENSANQILQLQWTKVKFIALNKSILKGLQFNKHFLTYCK